MSTNGTTERERQWWYDSAVDGVGKQRNIGDCLALDRLCSPRAAVIARFARKLAGASCG